MGAPGSHTNCKGGGCSSKSGCLHYEMALQPATMVNACIGSCIEYFFLRMMLRRRLTSRLRRLAHTATMQTSNALDHYARARHHRCGIDAESAQVAQKPVVAIRDAQAMCTTRTLRLGVVGPKVLGCCSADLKCTDAEVARVKALTPEQHAAPPVSARAPTLALRMLAAHHMQISAPSTCFCCAVVRPVGIICALYLHCVGRRISQGLYQHILMCAGPCISSRREPTRSASRCCPFPQRRMEWCTRRQTHSLHTFALMQH